MTNCRSIWSHAANASKWDGNPLATDSTRFPYANSAALSSGRSEGREVDVGVNFFLASGYGGQTLENLALPGEGNPFERITGFPLRSYVTASIRYHFRRAGLR
jgi:hypothetical protein